MCGPAVVLGALAVSTAMSAYSSISSGQYQAAQANYQAQVAKNNAVIAGQNATNSTLAGEEQQQQAGFKTAATMGAERAALGASGVDPNSGSALDVQSDQATKGMLDQLTIVNNAARQSYGYTVQAQSDTSQAALDNTNASALSTAGDMNAFGSILSGVSSVGDKYIGFQKSGALNN